MQYLSAMGYINFDKMKADAEKTLDQDGDGDFDEKDKKILEAKLDKHWKRVLSAGIGFLFGFAFALKVRRVNIQYDIEWEK